MFSYFLFLFLFIFFCVYILAKHWHKRHWNSLSSKLIKNCLFFLFLFLGACPTKNCFCFFFTCFVVCFALCSLLLLCVVKNADEYSNVVVGFVLVVWSFFLGLSYPFPPRLCIQNIVVLRWKCIPAAAMDFSLYILYLFYSF